MSGFTDDFFFLDPAYELWGPTLGTWGIGSMVDHTGATIDGFSVADDRFGGYRGYVNPDVVLPPVSVATVKLAQVRMIPVAFTQDQAAVWLGRTPLDTGSDDSQCAVLGFYRDSGTAWAALAFGQNATLGGPSVSLGELPGGWVGPLWLTVTYPDCLVQLWDGDPAVTATPLLALPWGDAGIVGDSPCGLKLFTKGADTQIHALVAQQWSYQEPAPVAIAPSITVGQGSVGHLRLGP